ncbi:D-alanyl-D-alanine carboxypeptidase [Streptomyces venezuelae]|uniref:D-alanyl-D-alanine carboxypeptidase n=1 Tax=Streptomyces venezuelae TaxID=54571 RepID=A0A5P2AVR7_STRVZ|nr:serine hydrolase [Streptomyces venezuelae]QES21638.1 D-alanyl-D-alanine carboxypeptidase [Streptomyces venezuelae]
MAGESPDKAEQQGSSEETAASGGGGRDPRLAALREADSAPSESSSDSSNPSGSSVQVDQATAVFRTLAPRTSEDDAPKPAASAEKPEGDRLKAAVAAWVASADDEESEPAAESSVAPAADGAAEDADEDLTDETVDAEPADAEPADAEPVAEAVAEPADEPVEDKASAESWFAARKPSETEKAEKAAEAEKAAAEPAAASDGDDEPATDGPAADEPTTDEPVDQPTAMFKIVRPPVAPAVDQPTTALKLPQSLREDYDSERTSTFVPLRADIPAERKAEQARQAQASPKAPAPAPKPATGAAEASKAPAAPTAPKASGAAAEAAPVPPASLVEAERTRQQPLPPLPPLDLLAELTNTPPPKPTALRTTARRVRIWTPLVVLLLIVFAIVQMVRPLPAPTLTLSASPTFTFEGGELQMPWPSEGQGAVEVEGVGSMGQYGPQKPAPIASVTKTMTAYVILRDHPLKGSQQGPEIEIDQKAADQGKAEHESTAPVQTGQTYTEKELLQLLMIPSANNVARLLARWDAGSEAAFVAKMNAAAKDLGMTQSTYTDPSGLLDSTVSTPQDQLKLAKAVMQYDVFREIVNTPNVTVDGIPGRIENNNSSILLKPGVSGIKTGSSTPAGGNLLWSANTVVDGETRRILGIVMGAKDADQLGKKLQLAIDNSYKLIQQAQKDVTSAVVVRKGQVLGHIDDGLGGLTPVVATKELKAIGWPGLKVKLELTDGGKAVPHAGKAGDVIGQVSIGTGVGKVSAPVALEKDLVEPGFDRKLTRLG